MRKFTDSVADVINLDEIKSIESNYKDSESCLLEILSSRLKRKPALTCNNIDKALRSRTVDEHTLADDFQSNFECRSVPEKRIEFKKESNKKSMAAKCTESESCLKMSKKESERIRRNVESQERTQYYVESEDESKSDESENIQKAMKSAEVERQVHERDEPKSKQSKKRARKKEKILCASEQPETDEYKEYERKQIKGEQKQKIQFSEMAASPQSGAESDKKIKSVKEPEKFAPEIMNPDSENKSSDKTQILSTKSEKAGNVRERAGYSEVHQPQSAKIKEVKYEAGKIPEKEGSTKKQHSALHGKTAVAAESDDDTSEQPHRSKKKLEAEETESEESFSESTSDESETESPKHKEKVKPKSPTDTEGMYHDSDEEIEKVIKNKMPWKSKLLATAKSSPHSEKEQYKQKKGKRSVDMKEQETKSELRAKASREKLQKPDSQIKGREKVKETDWRMKAKRLVVHSSKQASDESETDSKNKESDSGNDSSEDSEDEEEKRETDEVSSTAPSEEEVKKKRIQKSVSHKKKNAKKEGFEEERMIASKSIFEPLKYNSCQGFDETCTRKVKVERESESASLKYDSPGDDEQSDPGHGSRDREEHDIQQKRRKKKKQRRESSLNPTAFGICTFSTSQEEKKKRPVSKKQGHRKKHVRKMKEKSGFGRPSKIQKRKERKNERQRTSSSSCETDSSSPECDMQKTLTNTQKKRLRTIFKNSFGKICISNFNPLPTASLLQEKGLISQELMEEMLVSPDSPQTKIIGLVKALDKRIRAHPVQLLVCIEVLLKNEVLLEIGKEMLSGASKYTMHSYRTDFHAVTFHFIGQICPDTVAAKFPSLFPTNTSKKPDVMRTPGMNNYTN